MNLCLKFLVHLNGRRRLFADMFLAFDIFWKMFSLFVILGPFYCLCVFVRLFSQWVYCLFLLRTYNLKKIHVRKLSSDHHFLLQVVLVLIH